MFCIILIKKASRLSSRSKTSLWSQSAIISLKCQFQWLFQCQRTVPVHYTFGEAVILHRLNSVQTPYHKGLPFNVWNSPTPQGVQGTIWSIFSNPKGTDWPMLHIFDRRVLNPIRYCHYVKCWQSLYGKVRKKVGEPSPPKFYVLHRRTESALLADWAKAWTPTVRSLCSWNRNLR